MTVTSPELPVNQGIVKSGKEFSDSLTGDLTDEEIERAFRIITATTRKWQEQFRSKFREVSSNEVTEKTLDTAMKLVSQMEDEITYRLATEANILSSVDAQPVFFGEPPIVDILGPVGGMKMLDHDQKEYEVKKSKDRGEAFLGQKETINSKTKAKKRAKSGS